MNFDDAIAAHVAWRMKLSSYLAKPNHSLNADEVAKPTSCELGHWIAGEGQHYAAMREFSTLQTEHAHFHKAAADVVRRADSGQKVSEEVALGAHSQFADASKAVVNSLMALKSKLADPKKQKAATHP